jgi:hypothetical protein
MYSPVIAVFSSVLLLLFTIMAIIQISLQEQPAAFASPYSAGYDHGCDDAKKGGHPYLDEKGGAESHTVKFMQGYDAGYGDCSGHKLKKYDSTCPAGSANPDEGCELEGYHCTSDGCGNYVHGVCETCTTTDGGRNSDSSSSSHKGDFKIKIIVQNANEVRSGADDVRIYIQEYPQYGFPHGKYGTSYTEISDTDEEGNSNINTFDISMPKGLIKDGESFHICLDGVDSADQALACYKMVNHEGKHVESLTIDAKGL